jgi:hypothetical protein
MPFGEWPEIVPAALRVTAQTQYIVNPILYLIGWYYWQRPRHVEADPLLDAVPTSDDDDDDNDDELVLWSPRRPVKVKPAQSTAAAHAQSSGLTHWLDRDWSLLGWVYAHAIRKPCSRWIMHSHIFYLLGSLGYFTLSVLSLEKEGSEWLIVGIDFVSSHILFVDAIFYLLAWARFVQETSGTASMRFLFTTRDYRYVWCAIHHREQRFTHHRLSQPCRLERLGRLALFTGVRLLSARLVHVPLPAPAVCRSRLVQSLLADCCWPLPHRYGSRPCHATCCCCS